MNRNDLFKKLFNRCNGYIELRTLPSCKRTFISLSTDWQTLGKGVDKFCEEHKDHHLYFGIATRNGKGGKKENIVSIPCLWAEMDYKHFPKATESRVQEIVNTFSFKPTITIKSGGGVYVIFLLEKPVDLKSSEDVHVVNSWIRSELNKLGECEFDKISEVSRIIRLPDTVNHKYENKPLCQVVEINDTTYKLKDFLEKIPAPTKKHSSNNDKHGKVALSGLATNPVLIKQVEYWVSRIEKKKIFLGDDSYDSWLRIGFALADGLNEIGRTYFHRLSKFSDKYDVNECDEQYEKCLNEDPPEDKITIKTFFHYAREAILNKKRPELIKDISVSELMQMEFPEPKWIVPSIIPEGLSLLCGRPKHGKSILSVNLAVAIAKGAKALGKIPVEKTGVLYLALEDTPKRLQKRLRAVLQGVKTPESLFVNMSFSSIPNGGIEQLVSWLKHHKEVGFVIIDTYAKIKGQRDNKGDLYLDDYKEMAKIKDVADSHNVGILLIHHTRKEESEDVFDTVLGTTGITGAADTIIILVKKKSTGNLHVSGRDVEDATFAMKFDRKTLSWILDDDALKYTLTPEKKAIYKLLEENGHPMRLKDIACALGKKVSNIGHMLKDDVFYKTNYGKYTINKE